jgi:hypothetical protein
LSTMGDISHIKCIRELNNLDCPSPLQIIKLTERCTERDSIGMEQRSGTLREAEVILWQT